MTAAPFTTGWPPEWPLPPGRPPMPTTSGTPLPAWIERSDTGQDWLQQRLFDNRMVLAAATRLTGQLLALDAAAQRPIRVHIDSPAADLTAALLVADTLDLVRVSTYGLVIGEVGGASLAMLMATDHRSAYPHARVRLSEPRADRTLLPADASDAARQHVELLADFVERLAQATHKSADAIRADLHRGRYLPASEAAEYGLLDALAIPDSATPRAQ
jgi:ATP-dependent Clp protease, protease subunit